MYETFEHTADMGLRVRAADLNQLFAEGAGALFSVMLADLATVCPVQELQFHIQAANIEDLWHDWLAELLFTFHGRRLALKDFDVEVRGCEACKQGSSATPVSLSAVARGEPIDLDRHEIIAEVKAVTWCALRVEQLADGWLGEVVLDI